MVTKPVRVAFQLFVRRFHLGSSVNRGFPIASRYSAIILQRLKCRY
jgi:hypothetical protein